MTTFERCSKLWKYLYVDELHVPKDKALELGSFVHEIIHMYLIGDPMKEFPTKPYFVYPEQVSALIGWAKKAKDFLTELGIADFEVEKKVVVGAFNGIIDVIGVDKQGDYHIVDWKTTSSFYTEHDIKTSAQLTAYAYLCMSLIDKLPKQVHFGVFDKNSGLFSTYTSSRTQSDVDEFLWHVNSVAERIAFGKVFRNPEACNAFGKKCHFYNKCWPAETMFAGGVKLPHIGGGEW